MELHFKTTKDFYKAIDNGDSFEKLNEKIYLIVHTSYLNDANPKSAMFDAWRMKIGRRMTDDEFFHLKNLYSCFIDRMYIRIIKTNEDIRRRDVLWQALVSLEMDCALLDCVEQEKPFVMKEFREQLNRKYSGAFDNILDDIEAVDVPYIKDFNALGRGLRPFKTKIREIFNGLLKTNSRLINDQTKHFKQRREAAEKFKAANRAKPTSPKAAPNKIDPTVIEQYEERIRRLENDVNEYKRQRDEQIEYAQTQYDRGIRELFQLLNDDRYSQIINYFYALMLDGKTEANLRSYLENFFMALEEFDITPINGGNAAKFKSPGWKLRDIVLEKPVEKK